MPSEQNGDQDKTALSPFSAAQPANVLPHHSLVDGIYQIEKEIGAGGAGSVYKVQQIALKKNFALKVLHDTYSDVAMRRFHKEAQIAAGLDHANLVRAVHSGTLPDGKPFYVMDLVSGMTLAERLEEGPLRPSEVIDVFLPLCLALDYAHAQGLVHRDLKPGNTVLTVENGVVVPKIIDFGIAHLALSESTKGAGLTRTGEIFGTPKYMSPEQSLSKKIDQRSDIYSLGCMMFECLTGTVPFTGENAIATIMLHVSGTPPTLREAAPDKQFARGWQEVLDRMLAKEPADRFQSCAQVAHGLEAIRDNTVEIVSKPKVAKKRLKPAVVASLCVAGICVIAGGGAYYYCMSSASETNTPRPAEGTLALVAKKYPGIEKSFERAVRAASSGDWNDGLNASQASLAALKIHNMAELNPEDASAMGLRNALSALCYFNSGQTGDERMTGALLLADEAIKDDPYVGEYFVLRSKIKTAMGNKDAALEDLAQSKKLRPTECDRIMRGVVDSAAKMDVHVCTVDPDGAKYAAAKKLLLDGSWHEARADFYQLIKESYAYTRAKQTAPDTRRISLCFALASYSRVRESDQIPKKTEMLEQALKNINKAIELDSLPAEFYRIKSMILTAQELPDQAAKNDVLIGAIEAQNADPQVNNELRSTMTACKSSAL